MVATLTMVVINTRREASAGSEPSSAATATMVEAAGIAQAATSTPIIIGLSNTNPDMNRPMAGEAIRHNAVAMYKYLSLRSESFDSASEIPTITIAIGVVAFPKEFSVVAMGTGRAIDSRNNA